MRSMLLYKFRINFCSCYSLLFINIFAIKFPSVRLVKGPTRYEGTVELYYDDQWGTVCDDGWDLKAAEVVCGELGLGPAKAALSNAHYGQGSGVIWLDDVKCTGTELTIRDCSHSGWRIQDCTHAQDAGVHCSLTGNI